MKSYSIAEIAGFEVAAVKAGIKPSGKYDLGLIVADKAYPAAATFTTNKVVGPAVTVSREHVRNGRIRAVFVNAGNANTCTGKQGRRDVIRICKYLAKRINALPEEILVCSTGIIGKRLPMPNILAGIDNALEQLSDSADSAELFSRAILTTDKKIKTACREFNISGNRVRLSGTCKGSGMIAPNMATMLGFITTDINISPAMLRHALKKAVAASFNKVSIDSHTSTSDTAIIMSSCLAGNERITTKEADYAVFADNLQQLCDSLSRQMAADGEGAHHLITIRLRGAVTARDARKALRAVVDSPLVRCAFNGADPNWGRIVSALGYSGAKINPEKISCKIAGIRVFSQGRPVSFDAKLLNRKMKTQSYQILINIGDGDFEDFCYTCDLSREYVTINADYHT